jgi:O-acetyl-ADP-ribose deacetylase (regulator of RNase III)
MNELRYTWRLSSVTFTLAKGDLFEVPVKSIVNSEQTNFVLAFGGRSVSSQIRTKFGADVQRQLDEQTNKGTFDPGTVLTTTGGGYSAIYHAGFHHPTEWLDASVQDSETEHLEVIRRCVRRILELVRDAPFQSVAFPLVGSGIFGLDPRLVARNFFEDVFQFASEATSNKEMHVWLVVYDEPTFHSIIEAGIQAWLTHTMPKVQWEPFGLGIPYLDLFEDQVNRERHPRWSAWMHVRYAELATGYLAFVLGAIAGKKAEHFVPSGKPLTFGKVRTTAEHLAFKLLEGQQKGPWQQFLAKLMADAVSTGVIRRLNDDRNAIAHGLEAREASVLRADIEQFIQKEKWKDLSRQCQAPGKGDLPPWLVFRPGETQNLSERGKRIGVFQRWKPGERTYVIPWSGAEFVDRDAGIMGGEH